MCLSAIALDPAHPRFTFVVAANRDEFHDRPTAPLAWWDDDERILAGRDLQAGGSWLGLSRSGRFALLTNVRGPQLNPGPSRGTLVVDWLRSDVSAQTFRATHREHGAYNLIAADFAHGGCWWLNPALTAPQALGTRLHGLSNALLDTPWQKVERLKQRVAAAIDGSADSAALAQHLLHALSDERVAPDDDLPQTGVALEIERALSAAFIRMPKLWSGGYGTRCSTVVISDAAGHTQVWERSFDREGRPSGTRHEHLIGWPPPRQASERAISTCGMPASSNGSPRAANPART
jgi:uncharacterized protein with NRDE domain